METLDLTNFLTLKQAKLRVRPFTILIGPQANGKSVIAKVLYFFRDFLSTQYIRSIETQGSKRDLQNKGIAYFEQVFPRYAWQDQDFKLMYRSDDLWVSLSREGKRNGKKPEAPTLEKLLIRFGASPCDIPPEASSHSAPISPA